MESILNGLIDLHVHAGPSVADRAIDAFEMYERASRRGYKAFVVKDHYFPTMMSAMLVQKHTRSAETQIFGQIVLNNSVGGINLKAVDIACSMGAKIVTMPTVSAFHHIKAYQERSFCGGNSKSVQETPIYYLDECGKVKPVVIA
ncbi:MAG TPA: DUF6282 family protein, partial [Negativicutes bacterium]|nr:DUF6282 family protein [Negativicutes bacterium]